MNLGENIYRLRTGKNLSQGDLADALEVSRQSISKWENNSAVPELDKLTKMSRLFEVTLDELVTGETTTVQPQEKKLPLRQIFGISCLILALLTLVVSFLFGNTLGLHMHLCLQLVLYLVLLELIALYYDHEKVAQTVTGAYLAMGLISIFLNGSLSGSAFFGVLYIITVAVWYYLRTDREKKEEEVN